MNLKVENKQENGSTESYKSIRHERHPWQVAVQVEILEDSSKITGDSPSRTITVTTQDLSRNGFAFTYQGFIHPGTMIQVSFDMLPHQPVYLGTVRHCNNIGGMMHLVGVQFHTPQAEAP